jgi:hypothetical protein
MGLDVLVDVPDMKSQTGLLLFLSKYYISRHQMGGIS